MLTAAEHERDLLTTAEAAEYMRYRTAGGLRRAIHRGELIPDFPHGGPNRTHLFRRQTLDAFLRSRSRLVNGRALRDEKERDETENQTVDDGEKAEAAAQVMRLVHGGRDE